MYYIGLEGCCACTRGKYMYYCPRGCDELYCFRRGFFLCMKDNSWTATLSLMIFCRNMYVDNRTTLNEFKGHRSKVKVIFVSGPKFIKLFSSNVEKLVVPTAVFHLSIAWSVPEIFAIEVKSCPKSSALLITHEPPHLPWWNFARTCAPRQPLKPYWISRLKFKVTCVFRVFFCVHDAAATRGQYLALSKVWWSCLKIATTCLKHIMKLAFYIILIT